MRKTKKCFKCGKRKVVETGFYVHPRMLDGHLNKCKKCTKKNTKTRADIKGTDKVWIESERARGRRKYHRLYRGKVRGTDASRNKRYLKKYPEKREARLKVQCMPRPIGFEMHHWSYNEIHYKDVIALSKKDHMKAHRFLVYDQSFKMYRRKDNNKLLDSKYKHERYIKSKIKNEED